MRTQYIGITGFMESEEIVHLLERIPEQLWKGRQLMVGILVSSKTKAGLPNKWPGRYPSMKNLSELFLDDPHCLNLIHYNTDEADSLPDDLEELGELAGPSCHGFQLNMCWPETRLLRRFRTNHPDDRLVLQLGGRALEMEGWEAGRVVDRVRRYVENGLITDVLYDPSGGKGVFASLETALPVLLVLAQLPGLGVGLAGGLRFERLWELAPVFCQLPHLNLDAEGQLRWPEEEKATNRLDLCKAYAYLIGSLKLPSP